MNFGVEEYGKRKQGTRIDDESDEEWATMHAPDLS